MVYDGILIGLIVGFFRAGLWNGLRALSRVAIRGGLIFPVLLLLQFGIFYLEPKSDFLSRYSGYFFAAVYVAGLTVLWLNRKEKGFWLIFTGVALNFLVMAANGGRMPVSLEAVSVLDPVYTEMLQSGTAVTKHMLMDESTRLAFLGDIIPLTSPYPRDQAISIGDVIMNVGIFVFIQQLMLKSKAESAPPVLPPNLEVRGEKEF